MKPKLTSLYAAEAVLIRGIHKRGGEDARLEKAARWIRKQINQGRFK